MLTFPITLILTLFLVLIRTKWKWIFSTLKKWNRNGENTIIFSVLLGKWILCLADQQEFSISCKIHMKNSFNFHLNLFLCFSNLSLKGISKIAFSLWLTTRDLDKIKEFFSSHLMYGHPIIKYFLFALVLLHCFKSCMSKGW